MSGFLSGLVGGYSGLMLQKAEERHREKMAGLKAELEVIKSAFESGTLTEDAKGAAFQRMQEITGEMGGTKRGKGGFNIAQMFRNLTGRQEQGSTRTVQDVMRERGAVVGRVPTQMTTPTESVMSAIGGAAPTETRAQAAPTTGEIPMRGGGPVPAPPEEGQPRLLDKVPTRVAMPEQPERPTQVARMFKTEQEMFEQQFEQQKRIADYQHQQRLEEIDRQYGQRLTREPNISGAGLPPEITSDFGGNPIDRSGKTPYTALRRQQDGKIMEVVPQFRPPEKLTGPEAKIDSMAKNIMADAQAKGRPITEEQAKIQARQMALQDARNAFFARLETLRGKQFANKIRSGIESGTLTAPQARAFMAYVTQEARFRWANDPDIYVRYDKPTPKLIEDEIYQELGTTKEQISTFARAGAKPTEPPKRDTQNLPKGWTQLPGRD